MSIDVLAHENPRAWPRELDLSSKRRKAGHTEALTCVRISSTSLNPIVVSASLVCSIVTTFLLCSETCLPPAPAFKLDCVKACNWAI